MGHSNKMLLKMGVDQVLRTEVRLLSFTVFLLEKNISLFHNLGVSKNSHFELLPPPTPVVAMHAYVNPQKRTVSLEWKSWETIGFAGRGSVKYFLL